MVDQCDKGLEATRPANYKGVEFHIESISGSGGRHIIEHDYPNKEFQDVEDLGKKSNRFEVTGYIIDKTDLREKVRKLNHALESRGSGNFYHPLFNDDFNCRCLSWNINSRQDSLGRINFAASLIIVDEKNSEARRVRIDANSAHENRRLSLLNILTGIEAAH